MKINRNYTELSKLVDAIIDNRGKTVPTSKSGIPLIATNCIKHSSIYPTLENLRYISEETYKSWFRSHIQPNDILFVNKGTPGRACIVPDPVSFVVAQDMVGLRFNKEYNPFYMLAVLRSKEIQQTIENNHVGLVIPHYRKQELVKLNLPILNKKVRDQIGYFYLLLSQKIEINNKINIELENIAKIIYDYWFIQFDFPDENGKPYKSSGGKMIWNEELKKIIPFTWKVGGLNNIGDIVGGSTPSKTNSGYFTSDGTPWITPKDLSLNSDKKFISKGEIDVTQQGIKAASLRLLPKGTILLSSRAPIGYIAISRSDYTTTNQGFKSLVPNNLYSTEYLFYTVKSYVNAMIQYASGSTFSEISASTLKMIKIPIPNSDLVAKYTGVVNNIFNQQDILELENKELVTLRDWLLPMLMNGQLKIN